MATVKLKLYGEVSSIPCEGEYINPSMVYDFIQANLAATTFEIHLQTYGGNVDEGFAIYSALKNSGKELIMYIDGYCMSAGTIIATAAKLGNIIISKTDVFLIHCPFMPPFTLVDSYTADQLKLLEAHMRRVEDRLINHYAEYYGKSTEEIKIIMDKDIPMSGQEAFDAGLVGKVIDIKAENKIKLKAVATFNTNINKNNEKMSENMEEQKGWFKTILDKISGMEAKFPKVKNMILKDVTGADLELEKTEGEPAVGDKVTNPKDNEGMLMPNGTTIVIVGGEITEIKPKEEAPPANEAENLKAQIAELTIKLAEVENLKIENKKVIDANVALTEQVKEQAEVINQVKAMGSKFGVDVNVFDKTKAPKELEGDALEAEVRKSINLIKGVAK